MEKNRNVLFPFEVEVELTTECDLQCSYCYAGANDEKKILTLDDVKSIYEQVESNKGFFVFLGGGEPLMHPQIEEILALASKSKIATLMSTNGNLLLEKTDILDFFRSDKPLRLQVSCNALSQNTYQSLTGVSTPPDYSLIIETAARSNVPICVSTVVTKNNMHEVLEIGRMAKEAGAGRWHIISVMPGAHVKSLEEFNGIVLSPEEWIEMESQVKDFSDKTNFPFDIQDRCFLARPQNQNASNYSDTRCAGFSYKLYVSASGHVYPCGLIRSLPLGSLKEDSLKNLWSSKKRNDLKDYMAGLNDCDGCRYFDSCMGGCPAGVIAWDTPMDPMCPHEAKVGAYFSEG